MARPIRMSHLEPNRLYEVQCIRRKVCPFGTVLLAEILMRDGQIRETELLGLSRQLSYEGTEVLIAKASSEGFYLVFHLVDACHKTHFHLLPKSKDLTLKFDNNEVVTASDVDSIQI